MSKKRKVHSATTKAKASLEAIHGYYTINELASKFEVHPTQLSSWKKHLQTEAKKLFADKRRRGQQSTESQESRLFEEIGLKVELDWLKKSLNHSVKEKRALIDCDHSELSITRQCALLRLT